MIRKLLGTMVVASVLCVSAVMADEIKGKAMKVDADNNKITLKDMDGKETEYTVDKDCKFPKMKSKDGGGDRTMDLKGLAKMVEKSRDKGVGLTVVTNDKKVITEVKSLDRPGRPDKKDK